MNFGRFEKFQGKIVYDENEPTKTYVDVDPAEKSAKMNGALAMHGVEKPIGLDVQFLGRGKDLWGNERAGFHAATTSQPNSCKGSHHAVGASSGIADDRDERATNPSTVRRNIIWH